MHSNRQNTVEKLLTGLKGMNGLSKAIIYYGFLLALAVFAIGAAVAVFDRTLWANDPYTEFIAYQLIKTSFTLFAEAVIGGIVLDYFNKQ